MVFFAYGPFQYRLLDVAGPGGSLLANSRPIASPVVQHGWAGMSPMLTPDGEAVISESDRRRGRHGQHSRHDV